jgi:hypothetical protein
MHILAFFLGAFVGVLVSFSLVLSAASMLRLVLPDLVLRMLLSLFLVWAILSDIGLPFKIPYRSKQVPEWLRAILPISAVALTYGFMLGVGFLTLFTYSAQVAMLAAIPFQAGLAEVVMIGGIFAFGKTLVLVTGLKTDSVDEITSRFQCGVRGMRVLRATTAAASSTILYLILSHT